MLRRKWCCRGDLNTRPLPYQGSALPLSYGSSIERFLCFYLFLLPIAIGFASAQPTSAWQKHIVAKIWSFPSHESGLNEPYERPIHTTRAKEKAHGRAAAAKFEAPKGAKPSDPQWKS